ncbi:MAG: replication-associated recombination protein A, partial [Pseudoflavonifractor sp.]
EARIPLAQAAVLMATAPKSNASETGIDRALADLQAGRTGDIPRHLQNKHADSAGMEQEQGYLYPHAFPNHYVKQQYLPDAIKDAKYYEYGDNKTEQAAKAYWDKLK